MVKQTSNPWYSATNMVFSKKNIRSHSNNKTWYAAMNSPRYDVNIWLLRAAWIDHWPSALPKCIAQHKANLRPFRMVFGMLNIIFRSYNLSALDRFQGYVERKSHFSIHAMRNIIFVQIHISGISHESCPHLHFSDSCSFPIHPIL